MSRLCRLKTAKHGDDGKWAHNEIVSLRKQRDELLELLVQMHNESTKFGSFTPIGAFHQEMADLICRMKGGA